MKRFLLPLLLTCAQLQLFAQAIEKEQKPLWTKWFSQKQLCDATAPRQIEEGAWGSYPASSSQWGSPFVDLSFMIWQSKMWGFEFAAKSTIPTDVGSANVTLKEKAFVPDFAWRPGFKVELGYQFPCDGWSVDTRWTWYRGEATHLKKHIDLQTNPPGMGVVPLWFYPFYTVLAPSQIRFYEASLAWRHYFDSVDLEIARLSLLSPKTSFQLIAGLKGAWQHQYARVDYQKDGSTIEAIYPGESSPVSYTLIKSAVTFHNRSWGGGPRVGFNSNWNMSLGTSVLINGAFSLLYSALETHRDQDDLNLNTDTGEEAPFHMDLKTSSHQLKPVVEAQLGVDWTYNFAVTSEVGILIAYELQYWWEQNNLRRNYSRVQPGGTFSSRGDLQMHGLTATASYRY